MQELRLGSLRVSQLSCGSCQWHAISGRRIGKKKNTVTRRPVIERLGRVKGVGTNEHNAHEIRNGLEDSEHMYYSMQHA